MSPGSRLGLSILLLIAVFLVGAGGYMVIESDRGLSFFDAAYMTVITLSTVGYTEPWPMTPAARMWTIALIIFGISVFSVTFTSLLALFVSGELRSIREHKKMEQTLDKTRRHVIVCGYGRMGSMVVSGLLEQEFPVVVVDESREIEDSLREQGVPHVIGDATDENVLLKAGIERARSLVVALPSDADNVFITLTAHALSPDMQIVARADQMGTEAKLKRAGATRVVSPHRVSAAHIANMLARPNVVDFIELAARGVELEIDEYVVGNDSPLRGRPLKDSLIREKTGATVVAIKCANGETLYNPKPDARLAKGDTLIVVGPSGVSTKLDRIECDVAQE